MADFSYYNDLDKGTYLQAKQLLVMVAIAKATGAAADPETAETVQSAEDDARSMLTRLAQQAQRQAAGLPR